MKKLIIFVCFIFCGFGLLNAQGIYAPLFKMKSETPLRPKIYLDKTNCIGDKLPFNVDSLIKATLPTSWAHSESKKQLKLGEHFRYQNIYQLVDEKGEADVVVKPEFHYKGQAQKNENWLRELSGKKGIRIPYKEVRAANLVDASLLLRMTYKDGSCCVDTMAYKTVSERTKGKKMKPLKEMEKKMYKSLRYSLWQIGDVADGAKVILYSFPKVKVKDKALKTSLKTVYQLAKEGKLKEIANVYRQIIDKEPSPEAHLCLGVCYELAGDFDKAQEEFKHKMDFHIKMRMKEHLKLRNYMRSIGVELRKIEI
jgi:tetratricopeptide (TPR) repeat protein